MLDAAVTIAFLFGIFPPAAAAPDSAPRSLPHLKLVLPTDMPSETIQIEYFLAGSFGGYGEILASKQDQTFIDIPASYDGKPAKETKIIAYLPGCEFLALDVPVQETDISETLKCIPLGTQRLHGRILSNPAIGDALSEITVDYEPMWSRRFFGITDGMTMIVHLCKVPVRNGEFTVDLPDFARQAKLGGGHFLFSAGQRPDGTVATLNPVVDGKSAFGVEARSSYEGTVELVAEKQ